MVKKAQMNLGKALEQVESEEGGEEKMNTSVVLDSSQVTKKLRRNDKKQVPIYYDPLLHDAMQTICFCERHKKTSINSLVLEGLELLFKERGFPTIVEIVSGDKKINV